MKPCPTCGRVDTCGIDCQTYRRCPACRSYAELDATGLCPRCATTQRHAAISADIASGGCWTSYQDAEREYAIAEFRRQMPNDYRPDFRFPLLPTRAQLDEYIREHAVAEQERSADEGSEHYEWDGNLYTWHDLPTRVKRWLRKRGIGPDDVY